MIHIDKALTLTKPSLGLVSGYSVYFTSTLRVTMIVENCIYVKDRGAMDDYI